MNQNQLSGICPNCGARIPIDPKEKAGLCPYCGAAYATAKLLGESEAERVQRLKNQAYIEVEEKKIEAENQRTQQALKAEKEKEQRQQQEAKERSFKKSKFNKWLFLFGLISVLAAAAMFMEEIRMAGIIAGLQAVLYFTAWLMGKHFQPKGKKTLRRILILVSLLLCLPYFGSVQKGMQNRGAENIPWDSLPLCQQLPEPRKTYGKLHLNSEENLWITLLNIKPDAYAGYRADCRNQGFTIESEQDKDSYEAFNEAGYHLDLRYNEVSQEMRLDLKAPMKLGEYQWPRNEAGILLPEPASKVGKIQREDEEGFYAYIGQTTPKDFESYIDLVSQKGFNRDYSKRDDFYYAEHEAGYTLRLSYEGANVISILVEKIAPPTAAPTASPAPTAAPLPTEAPKAAASSLPAAAQTDMINGMRREFKESMDEYERFMNDYVAFMTKYGESGNSISMMTDYLKMLSDYADMVQKFEAWEDGDLNSAEERYYLQVQSRVANKLLTVSLE